MVPQPVKYVLETLERAGFAACAVGGCVRETLLGRVPSDWDVTTAARPEQVLALFGGYAIPTGLRHGTVTVRAEGMSLEVTTFRADGAYTDHRRPDTVTFSDALEDDLCRRDLTVNAMAMDVRGHITDLFGGREDLQNGILRCVGDPERRFEEDALRGLRPAEPPPYLRRVGAHRPRGGSRPGGQDAALGDAAPRSRQGRLLHLR